MEESKDNENFLEHLKQITKLHSEIKYCEGLIENLGISGQIEHRRDVYAVDYFRLYNSEIKDLISKFLIDKIEINKKRLKSLIK